MKKILPVILATVLLPAIIIAQNRRPVIDITTSPKEWQNNQANVCAQVMTIPRIGLCASFNFQAVEQIQGEFLAQSSQWGIHTEVRIFPFGEPRPLIEGRNKFVAKAKKKNRKSGCPTFVSFGKQREKVVSKFLQGLYIAPGFIFRQQHLTFLPLTDEDYPVSDFQYKITSPGASLALGYQLRLGHLTLGAGWGIQVTQPRWAGPADIFGDALYSTTYPWKLNIQHGFRLEAGINF